MDEDAKGYNPAAIDQTSTALSATPPSPADIVPLSKPSLYWCYFIDPKCPTWVYKFVEGHLRNLEILAAGRSLAVDPFLNGPEGTQYTILRYLEEGNHADIALILKACCELAAKSDLLLELTFSESQEKKGGEIRCVLEPLPRDYFGTTAPTFLWAMAIGKETALAAALLQDTRVADFDPQRSPMNVTHVVARGFPCPRAQDVRALILKALSIPRKNVSTNPPWAEVIGFASSYGVPPNVQHDSGLHHPHLFRNFTLLNSREHLGIIALESGTRIWVEAVLANETLGRYCATVVKQEGQHVTVSDGHNTQDIDLMYDKVELDIVSSTSLRYNATRNAFERIPPKLKVPHLHLGSENRGRQSEHRVPFCPWKPSDDRASVLLENCAVSIKWLETFIDRADVAKCGGSTRDVTELIIKPATAERRCRYVELLPREEVGRATYFVSHRWGALFVEMVKSVLHYHRTYGSIYVSPRQSAFVWLDLFAVNQNDKDEDLALMGDVVVAARQTLLCVDRECQVLTRLWCVYEVWQTLIKGGARQSTETPAWKTLTLQVIIAGEDSVDDLEERQTRISKLWLGMSTELAVTGRQSDKERILAAMREINDPISLDLQIMSALCNTGSFRSGKLVSMVMPPWERTDMGGKRESDFKARIGKLNEPFHLRKR